MSMTHRKAELISSIVRMRTGDRPLFLSHFGLNLIRLSMKQLSLAKSFFIANSKDLRLQILIIKRIYINKISSYFRLSFSHLTFQIPSRLLSVYQYSFAKRVESVTDLTFPQYSCEASKFCFHLTFEERNAEPRLTKSQLHDNFFK
jgi:hypothetical protein